MTPATAAALLLTASVGNALAQVLLKRGASTPRLDGGLGLWLNPWSAGGYLLLLAVVYLTTVAMRVLPLKLAVPFGSLTYLLVPLLARALLGERLNRTQAAGLALVLSGLAVFNLPF